MIVHTVTGPTVETLVVPMDPQPEWESVLDGRRKYQCVQVHRAWTCRLPDEVALTVWKGEYSVHKGGELLQSICYKTSKEARFRAVEFAARHGFIPRPYQPGDVVEFRASCSCCDDAAEYVIDDGELVPYCVAHVHGSPMIRFANRTRRTVVYVRVEQRDGTHVWVVELGEG